MIKLVLKFKFKIIKVEDYENIYEVFLWIVDV